MLLPAIPKNNIRGIKVLLRADLDVEIEKGEGEVLRLKALVPTLKTLSDSGAKTIIIGHKGRPSSGPDENFSLKDICVKLSEISGFEIKFVEDIVGPKAQEEIETLQDGGFLMLENLRFNPGEEENSFDFVQNLANLGEIYVNDAFASSHREHSSIVGIPAKLPHYAGERLIQEVENLGKVFENPQRPLLGIVSGVKKDKLDYLGPLETYFDKILVGGRLPEYLGVDKSVREYGPQDKQVVANIIYDKEDITLHSIEVFRQEIKKAKTIVVAGVLGKYEDPGHRQGTKAIFEEVSNSSSFKIIGGGDSLVAIEMFSITAKFDWVSVGGGAMLEFLAKKTLPGIDALLR